jgi:hypothetical protein
MENGHRRRPISIRFRVTEDESASIRRAAEEANLTVSEYVRTCLLTRIAFIGDLRIRRAAEAAGLSPLEWLMRTVRHLASEEADSNDSP